MKQIEIALTGSSGRLGTALIPYLRSRGYSVHAYSRSAGPDYLDLSLLPRDLVRKPFQAVLHLAWSVVPAEAESDPDGQWKNDLPLLEQILSPLRSLISGGPKLIFFSSGAVYGEGSDERLPFNEKDPLNPKGLYAKAKVAAETMILEQMALGIGATILRITNPFGFNQSKDRPQGVIPALCKAAASQQPFTIWGDGTAIKDYIYIQDLCRGVECALKTRLEGVYNLASGAPVVLNELVAMMKNVTGLPIAVRNIPAVDWDVQHGRYSSDRFQEKTGWVPKASFFDSLKKYWNQYMESKQTLS